MPMTTAGNISDRRVGTPRARSGVFTAPKRNYWAAARSVLGVVTVIRAFSFRKLASPIPRTFISSSIPFVRIVSLMLKRVNPG
jgi:hypothetical protein